MSKAIRNGTVVTADRTWKADVLVKGDRIVAIGPDLHGDHDLDATGCYVMPGGIDPHTHLEMPFMGTCSHDDFDSGRRAALSGGTTMGMDFCLPSPGQSRLALDCNVFAGKNVKDLPRFVLSRGRLSVQEDKVDAAPGLGQFIAREPGEAVGRALSQWKEPVAPRAVERSGIPASGV